MKHLTYYKSIFTILIIFLLNGCGGVISSIETSYYNAKGDHQFKQKNYSQAFDYYKSSAQEGGAYGYYRLYVLYMNGYGVEKNEKTALDMLSEAARLGNSTAEVILGNRLIFTTKQQDVSKGLKLLESAASKENKYAYADLYTIYWNGIGVKKDLTKAGQYYRLAKAQGLDLKKNNMFQSKNSTTLSMKKLITQIQSGLKTLGFYKGKVDGVSGPMTRKSIATFQKFYGYPINSKVSENILKQINKEVGK